MATNKEDNPCCNNRGTLIITIEPCNKGNDEESDQSKQITSSRHDYGIPGFSPKTPRTMEIEIKIKGKDQKLFSEENIQPETKGFLMQKKQVKEEKPEKLIDRNRVSKGEEVFSELELISHDLEYDDDNSEFLIEMLKKRKYSSDSSESVVHLEKKPCPKTCPGKFICSRKRHFMGDKCHLHDPTDIGKQILEMHKTGKIRKISANIDKNNYPKHLLCTISEIRKLQAEAKQRRNIQEGSESSEVEISVADLGDSTTRVEKLPKKTQDQTIIKPENTAVDEPKEVPNVMKKELRSGCFCHA